MVPLRRALICVMALAITPAWSRVADENWSGLTDPKLCLAAADLAAARHGIPPQMMRAITIVETRRTVNGAVGPWPWTLNVGGEGFWHASRAQALAHAEREMEQGRRSIDLGCFQLNYRWHGENFSGPDEMLDPALAADYAARFLAMLHKETGDWMRAAGLYHSRTPTHADRYRGLVRRTLARFGSAPESLARLSSPGLSGREPRPNGTSSGGEGEPATEKHAGARAGKGFPAAPVRRTGLGVTLPGRGGASAVAEAGARARPGGVPAGAVALTLFAGQARPPMLRTALHSRAAQ